VRKHGEQLAMGARWRLIVVNLAALVAALDPSFVREIEAIAGPLPDWFRPESR
jgi:hypothetical protein